MRILKTGDPCPFCGQPIQMTNPDGDSRVLLAPGPEAAPKTAPPAPLSPPLSPPPLPPNGVPAANQRSVCGGERRKEWSGRSPRRQAETERSGISSDEVPVELSVELDGHAFSLQAPSLEGAVWILEYAGRMLEDLAGRKEDICDA